MASKRLLFVLSFVLLLGTLFLAVRQNRRRHQAEETLKKTTQDQAATLIEFRAEEKRLRLLDAHRSELQARIKQVALATEPSPLPNPNVQEMIDRDEHLQVLNFNARRAGLNATYAPLFQMLGLSEVQAQAVLDAMMNREEQQDDIMVTIRQQGLSMKDPAIVKLFRDVTTQYAQTLAELLGAEGYKKLEDFKRSTHVRAMVSGRAGAATVAGVPFSSAQAEHLVQLMAASTPEYQNKHSDINPANIDWEVVDAQAREILSPKQFNVFQNLEAQSLLYTGSRQRDRLNSSISNAAKEDKKAAIPSGSPGG